MSDPFARRGSRVKRPSSTMNVARSAQHFQLDQCLSAKAMDKLIYQMSSTAEARQKTKTNHLKSKADEAPMSYDIDGFSQFLAQQKAVSTLLFWKDAEDYTTLFGAQERSKTAEKIFQRYLEKGAEYEITGLAEAQRKKVKDELGSPSEEIFVDLQEECYNTMLFELFPAFWEAVKQQDQTGGQKRSKLTEKTTLREVIQANDLEIHLFAEYCRSHMCEESVTFLLEAGMYALLFDPLDLENQAARIFKLYLDPESEGRISGCSDFELYRIQKILEQAKVLQVKKSKDRGSVRRDSDTTQITSLLFQVVAREVENTLNLDVWPRYKEAVLDGTALTLATAGGGSDDAEMRKPSKAAVIKALKHPVQLEHLRNAASAQGMVESVDFCCEVQEYKLLFAAADRKPRAETMYKTYVMAGADLPINIPDSQTQKIEKNYEKHEPELFDDAYQELLQVISDNIFDRYIQELDRHSKVETKRPASPLAKAAESGGCCVLM